MAFRKSSDRAGVVCLDMPTEPSVRPGFCHAIASGTDETVGDAVLARRAS